MEELNVKEVVFEKDLNSFMNFTMKPNFKTCGPKLGANVKAFANELLNLNALEVISAVKNGGVCKMTVNGNEVEVDEEMLDIRIAAKEGYDVEMDNNLFVILDTNLTKELIDEGYAREFISKVQQMRKNNGYEMMDNIKIFYNGVEEIENAVKSFDEYIKSETLAVSIEKTDDTSYEVQNLNGFDTGIKLEKVN